MGGAVQNNVLGIATGVLIDDELCQLFKIIALSVRFGMKVSAVASYVRTLVFGQMMDAGTPCPVNGLIGDEEAWEANRDKIQR